MICAVYKYCNITQQRIQNKLKTCAKQKVAELKTEVENMGASYEEICPEILEGQLDGIKVTFIFSIKFSFFNSHVKIPLYLLYFISWFCSLFELIKKEDNSRISQA